MIRQVFAAVLSILMVSTASARDFMVEFVEEHYKESKAAYSHDPQIYHSIQVKTNAGPKLIVLRGENHEYRKWLRQYIARDKSFMVKVEDADNDRFISSKVFEVDVTRLHPFSGTKWGGGRGLTSTPDSPVRGSRILHGDRHILVIDRNAKRSNLVTSVINRMGYKAMVSRNGAQALALFRNQPDKFKMVIANHDIPGMPAGQFIEDLLKLDHQIPILVETGYNQPEIEEEFITRFSGAGSVMVKSVVLDNLQNTIKQLIDPMKANG